MASSEVGIVSSSPFGCVLKDRNRRDQCRDSNAKAAAFQANLKELVRDHFPNCISVSADENSESVDSGFGKEQGCNRNRSGHNRNLQLLSNNRNKVNGNKTSNDDSFIVNSTKSRILDRWAARQAREMVSSIEKQSHASSSSSSSSPSSSSTTSSTSKRENQQNSPAEPEASPEISNLGASSLVQIWEARLNRSNSMNNNLNPVSTSSRTNSGISNNENIEEHPKESKMSSDYVDERCESQHNHEDSFPDWEAQSDRTARSEPTTLSQGTNSDNGESERVRISDIIKKLTSARDDSDHEQGVNVCESPSRERRHSLITDHAEQREQREHRSLSQVISSPKIRGRQAFADLLMQVELDRHKELDSLVERQSVSRFSYRGRIQSMLRIRFLQRSMGVKDQKRPQSAGSHMKSSQGSTIMHLREKFSTGVDHGGTAQNDESTSGSPHTETANNKVHLQNSCTANRLGEDGHNQEATNAERKSTAPQESSVLQTSKDHQKESSPRTDVTQQGTGMEIAFLDPQGTSETTTVLNDWGRRNGISQDQEANHWQCICSSSQGKPESMASMNGWIENEMAEQQDADDHQQLYLDSHETAETIATLNDWEENEQADEEEETYEQEHYFAETNYDWLSEISRPRSYWEDRRQTWYQEMLSNSSENEIRQLLERRRVSTFLASDFRGTMDQLITSRVQRQTELGNYQEEEQEELGQETIRQFLLSQAQRHMHSTVSQEEQAEEGDQAEQVVEEEQEEEEEEEDDEEDEEQEEEEDEEEEQSPISDRFQESSDYFGQSSPSGQTASPSMIRTWSYRDHEVTDDSDPVVSTSSPPPLPSQPYYQDSRQSSFSTNRISIETELIYDLRGQIEQLHREMSELRKSIQSCVDMQVKMQPSNQPEVHRVRGMGNNSLDGAPKKHSCCICYEMQVDSLLYRCGHMCTCLKCAHELQWSSGKCPICRAPIMDVVRACMDS